MTAKSIKDSPTSVNKNRLHLLDFIRGITVISMVAYHTLWDIVYIHDIDIPFFASKTGYIWQQSICWTFILLSGFCFNLGRHKFKRGVTVLLGGMAVTAATVLFMPSAKIFFGVLTLLGSSMIICAVLEKWLKKIPHIIGGIVSAVLFLLLRNCNLGFLGFEELNLIKIPDAFYKSMFTAYLGFPPDNFYSADYFSLLPWLFLFLTGFYIYHILNKNMLNEKLFRKGKFQPINFIGKHALLIYLAHQPLIYIVLNIIM